jgi:NAD(P)-dependent dehydrogenase (short-subunit alcohol dehydrogenase family)
MGMTFGNRVAIVTGGASGIGRAVCEELAARGATVVVADIDEAGAEAVAALLPKAHPSRVDVRDASAVQRLVDETVRQHGRVDFMFNNAGVGVGGEVRELTIDHWRTAIEINLLGVVYGVAAAYPVMLRQGSGYIVNTASLAGLIASPGLAPYAGTKGAVVSLTTALRAEAAGFGVRASVVCPGFVDTAIYDSAIGVKLDRQDLLEKLRLPVISAAEAAREILKGVERNRAFIVFPRSARVLWRLTRLSPGLMEPFQRRMIAQLRTVRRREAAAHLAP